MRGIVAAVPQLPAAPPERRVRQRDSPQKTGNQGNPVDPKKAAAGSCLLGVWKELHPKQRSHICKDFKLWKLFSKMGEVPECVEDDREDDGREASGMA